MCEQVEGVGQESKWEVSDISPGSGQDRIHSVSSQEGQRGCFIPPQGMCKGQEGKEPLMARQCGVGTQVLLGSAQ